MTVDRDSEPGAYAKAMMFPPYAGAMSADGEFRRGFPDAGAPAGIATSATRLGVPARTSQDSETGVRRINSGDPAEFRSFHGNGDRRVGQ